MSQETMFLNFGLSEEEFMEVTGESSGRKALPDGFSDPQPSGLTGESSGRKALAGFSDDPQPSTSTSSGKVAALNVCPTCHKSFTRKNNLSRHMKTHTGVKSFACNMCEKVYSRKADLNQHIINHNKTKQSHVCEVCARSFVNKKDLMQHIRTSHPLQKRKHSGSQPASKKIKSSKNSALNVFNVSSFTPLQENEKDFIKFFSQMRPRVLSQLQREMEEKLALKWYAVVKAVLTRITQEGDLDYATPHFRSKCLIDLLSETLPEHIEEAFSKINKSFEEFTQRGSGWTLEKIIKIDVCTAKYQPLTPSSYIPLPKKLADKKAVLNIQNNDQKCLVWCILAHQIQVPREDKPERLYHYTAFENQIKLGNVQCPVPVIKIPTIERLNNLRMNIYGYEDDEIFPLYISPHENKDCINLLYITSDERQHYCLIRNFSRLLGDLTKHDGASFYCYRCLHRFMEEKTLKEHLTYCQEHSPQHIKMPVQGEHLLSFENVHYQHPLPFVIYADFEALITNTSEVHNVKNSSYTEKMNHHQACGYAYVIIGADGTSFKPIRVYRGPNAISHFLNKILEEKEELADILTNIVPLRMTPEDERDFKTAIICSLCKKPLNQDRVRDHDHLTGKYRGALHSACNLKYRLYKKIPVVFHNLKHYDGHLIMQEVGKIQDHDIHVIPSTMEKYISFSLSKKHKNSQISLTFIDSYQFMNTSLEKLVKNLSQDQFCILKEHFSSNVHLLLRKGVYPYEYMDSFSKFDETSLPPISAFSSTLSGETITPEDYQHAQNVWNTFHLQTMGDYHDLYVKSDVLQLADVFQNFRKLCMAYYNLDCVHLVTAPGLAWQGCLKMVDQPLELLTDINMHLFIEQGIRGGISMITKRWARANNKYVENYSGHESGTDMQLALFVAVTLSWTTTDTAKHLMCLPPSICFPPGGEPGCMIVLQCPCTDRGPASPSPEYARWHSVVAFIFRSKTPVPALTSAKEGILEKPQGDVREFSVKHLLFLLAFVIAPLLCWCLLTFFHEGKCRKKRQSPETEPMPTERIEEVDELPPETCPPVQVPTAPKFESPPPYREVLDPGESCLLAVDCGPPPSYEDAVRDPRCQAVLVHRIQDMDSE